MIELSSIEVKKMTVDDLEEVSAIEKRTFVLPWTKAQFRAEISNPFCNYLVAKKDRSVIGYVGFVCVEDEGYLTNIAVDLRFRGNGIGTMLMLSIFEKAVNSGVKKIFLDVRRSNMLAQKLYSRFGFREVLVRKRYYSDNLEDALVMASELSANTVAFSIISEMKENLAKGRH